MQWKFICGSHLGAKSSLVIFRRELSVNNAAAFYVRKKHSLINFSYFTAVQQQFVKCSDAETELFTEIVATLECGLLWMLLFKLPWKTLIHVVLAEGIIQTLSPCQRSSFPPVLLYILSVCWRHTFMFISFVFRTRFSLSEPEASFLQGAGQRGLWGLVVEKKGCKGLFFSEMEEILVCAERQLLVLVYQWRGGFKQCFVALYVLWTNCEYTVGCKDICPNYCCFIYLSGFSMQL